MAGDLKSVLARQKAAFAAHPFPSAKERRAFLQTLRSAVVAMQDPLAKAVSDDFGGRARMEVLFSEVLVSVNSLAHSRTHLERWMERREVPVGWPLQPARAWVMPQPVGVVGVISPWNYPLYLAMGPLASALAAGNRVMLKLSEHTPATSALLEQLITRAFPDERVVVVNGGADVGKEFASLAFDHLLFTGSTAVGREVMKAAAENLTPVTLELGGKSPAIVTESAKLSRATDDIAYGKWLNAGQTCIAPDYVLVPERLRESLVMELRRAVERRWPAAGSNPEYTSIINERQFTRLRGYLDEARGRGCEVIELGGGEATGRKLGPVIVLDPPADFAMMRDEIFGPVLPVCTYRGGLGEAIARVTAGPRPLALYLFTQSERDKNEVLTRTSSGGVSINETLLHIVVDDLPFGGIGASGMGQYHGQAGFDTFSKLKPVFERSGIGLGVLTRPPYGKLHEWMRRLLIR